MVHTRVASAQKAVLVWKKGHRGRSEARRGITIIKSLMFEFGYILCFISIKVIYVPHGVGHSVLNLDENLSITENFLGIAALDELAKFYAHNWNPMHFEVSS